MSRSTQSEKPKPKPAQTLLALAMLFQVKDKLKCEDWMVAREIIDANPRIAARIRKAIEGYGYEVDHTHLLEATVLLLVGMKIGISKRP